MPYLFQPTSLLRLLILAIAVSGCSSTQSALNPPSTHIYEKLPAGELPEAAAIESKPNHPKELRFSSNELNPRLNNDILQSELQRWWQTPYAYGGSNRQGVDCSALIRQIYYRLGYLLPRTTSEQLHYGRKVKPNRLLIGDVIFFHNSDGQLSHAGIYVGEGLFYHASSTYGVTISRLWHSYYRKRFQVAKRMVW